MEKTNQASFFDKEINMLTIYKNAHNEIIRNQQFGVSILDIRIRKEEERKQMNDSYYNVKDYASRGLSWNIAFLDNILRRRKLCSKRCCMGY